MGLVSLLLFRISLIAVDIWSWVWLIAVDIWSWVWLIAVDIWSWVWLKVREFITYPLLAYL